MNMSELQALLKERRSLLEYSHQQVADAASISRQFYGMIENGDRQPSTKVAKKIGDLLGINWTIFFEVNSNQELHNQKEVG